jgi:hypothetical protein
MSELINASVGPIVPLPRVGVVTRLATMDDLPFLDSLQKQHSKQVGYFPTKQFEGYIEMGGVLVAWASSPCPAAAVDEASGNEDTGRMPVLLGYVISRDRYLKRDELGVIYQLCVAPGFQRGLIGASLIQSVFERSAYGCKLYCCWCAQDIAANYFWESMGFVPIAFRAGSAKKKRVHIFWQRRINAEDMGERAMPYWYPCQTSSGAIGEGRLVFPIPPGTHWTEVQAVTLPRATGDGKALPPSDAQKTLREKKARKPVMAPVPQTVIAAGGLRFRSSEPAPAKPQRVRAEKPAVKIGPN